VLVTPSLEGRIGGKDSAECATRMVGVGEANVFESPHAGSVVERKMRHFRCLRGMKMRWGAATMSNTYQVNCLLSHTSL
jgi:hypothetical protein